MAVLETLAAVDGAMNLAQKLAEFMGFIESVDAKIEKLVHKDFQAGIESLKQFRRSPDKNAHLLDNAQIQFINALQMEKNESLFIAHICVAITHQLRGNHKSYVMSLQDALKVEIDDNEKRRYIGNRIFSELNPFAEEKRGLVKWEALLAPVTPFYVGKALIVGGKRGFAGHEKRIRDFEKEKTDLKKYLAQIK